MAAAKPGPGQRLGPRAVLIRTQEVARKLIRATVPLADSPVSALPRAPLVAGGPAGGAERFAVLALGIGCRAPIRSGGCLWPGVAPRPASARSRTQVNPAHAAARDTADCRNGCRRLQRFHGGLCGSADSHVRVGRRRASPWPVRR